MSSLHRMRTLSVESLAARLALSATTVETEPNNSQSSADAFVVPEDGLMTLSGNSTSDKDKDFFSFVAPATGRLNAVVDSPNGEFPQLEIETQQSVKVLETEPNDGIHSASAVLQEGVRYYARVRAKDDAAAEYLVHLEFATQNSGEVGGGDNGTGTDPNGGAVQVGDVTELEPNNDKPLANRFAFRDNGTASLSGESTSKDDRDFFRFVASHTGRLNIHVSGPDGNVAQLEVEDVNSVKLFETEPNDGINQGSVQVQEGQTYFVRLRSKSEAPSAYHVDLAFRQVGDSDGDGAFNTSDLVQIMQRGKFRSGEHCGFDDGDWSGDGYFDEQDIILAFQAGYFHS